MSKYSAKISEGLALDLPLVKLPNGNTIAVFDIVGQTSLTRKLVRLLASKIPISRSRQTLLTPDGKSVGYAAVLADYLGIECVIPRKRQRGWMQNGVQVFDYVSVTSGQQRLWLDQDMMDKLSGEVLVFDDVISGGGTIETLLAIVNEAGGKVSNVTCFFTEHTKHGVISLGHLPVWGPDGKEL